jgi:hypothetical protein
MHAYMSSPEVSRGGSMKHVAVDWVAYRKKLLLVRQAVNGKLDQF